MNVYRLTFIFRLYINYYLNIIISANFKMLSKNIFNTLPVSIATAGCIFGKFVT